MTSANNLAQGLADLSRFERGAATFAIGADGEIVYSGTVATVKMQRDEDFLAFVARLRRDHLRPGDTLELIANGPGNLDTARIYKRP